MTAVPRGFLRSAAGVFTILVGATALSYGTSLETALLGERRAGSVVLLVVFFKARLIGLRFMELETAILPLRLLFEAWIVVMGTVLLVLFWQ